MRVRECIRVRHAAFHPTFCQAQWVWLSISQSLAASPPKNSPVQLTAISAEFHHVVVVPPALGLLSIHPYTEMYLIEWRLPDGLFIIIVCCSARVYSVSLTNVRFAFQSLHNALHISLPGFVVNVGKYQVRSTTHL